MNKRIFRLLLTVLGVLIICILFINSSYFIENQEWKYSNGTYIGDWLEKSSFEIKDRIIYTCNGKAEIVYSSGKKLIIENIETHEKGFYVNK